ncbi:MAG: hypothetical protein R3E98_20425 [Gemmatimonadota bacterium]
MAMHNALRTALALAFLAVAACDSSSQPVDPSLSGEFSVTVTTSTAAQMTGYAVSSGQAGVGWSMTFITPGGDSGMLWVTEGMGRPDPGTYTIIDFVASDASPGPGEFIATVNMEGTSHDLQSVTGTLTITSSTAEAVSGHFRFSGLRNDATPQTGTVEGTFTTVNRDQ